MQKKTSIGNLKKWKTCLHFILSTSGIMTIFQLALREGKFADAVRMGNESRVAKDIVSRVPPEELLTLHNGVVAGYTWSSIQFDLNNLAEARVPLITIKSPTHTILVLGKLLALELRGSSSGWQEILDCLKKATDKLQLPRQGQNVYSAKFFRAFGDDFLDLVVSFPGS